MKLYPNKKIFINLRAEFFLVLIFILYRMPELGFDNINTDAPIWKTRTFQFSSAIFSLDFAKTNVTYHPGVLLMWISALGVKFYNLFVKIFYGELDPQSIRDYVGLDFTQKFLLLLFYAFVLGVGSYYLKKIKGVFFAVTVVIVLTFEPFFIGLTRVLHTDGLITVLSFSVFVTFYYFLLTKNKLAFFYSALFTALALLTKSNALFLVAFIGLSTFIFNLGKLKNIKSFIFRVMKTYSIWFLLVIIFFVLFWPAMWVTPIQTIYNYYHGIRDVGLEPHLQEWFGVETEDPGFWFYPIVYFIRSTPYFLVFSTSGILLFLVGSIKYKKFDLLYLLSLLFVLFYITALGFSDKKLGRYVLPIFPFMSLFFVYFLFHLKNKIPLIKNVKSWFFGFVIFVVFLSFIQTYKLFPDYLMYYSPIIGGWEVGKLIEEPKWPVGYSTLAHYLNNLPNSQNRYVLVRYGYLYNPWNISKRTGTLSQKTEKDPGSYFILEKYSDWRYLKGRGVKLNKILKVGGYDMFWIYEIIGNYEVTKNYEFIFPPGPKIDSKF